MAKKSLSNILKTATLGAGAFILSSLPSFGQVNTDHKKN